MAWKKSGDEIVKTEMEKFLIENENKSDLKHEFSEKYKHQKIQLLQQVSKTEYIRRKKVRRFIQITAMISIAIITIPVTVYAAVRLYDSYVIKEGYRTQYLIEQTNFSSNSVKVPLDLKLSYLPEGMIDVEDGVKYSDKSTPHQGGFTFCLYKMKPQEESVLTSYFSDSYEVIEVNGHRGIIIQKVENKTQTCISFDKEIYILFEELGYLLQIYAGEDVTKEEALSVAKGVDLIITKEDTATFPISYQIDLPSKDDMLQKDEAMIEEVKSQSGTDNIEIKRSSLVNMNEPVIITQIKTKDRYSFVIEAVHVYDSVSGVDPNMFFDYDGQIKPFINEDGTIKGYERKRVDYGDGITSNHEVISTEYINEKYVELTVRMSNLEIRKIEKVYMLPQLVMLEEKENGLKLCPLNFVGNNFFFGFDAFVYFDQPQFINKSVRSQYYFKDMEAKEEVEYHLGMIVDEDLLDQMFLKVINEHGDEIYIDIRQ
ncbi:MAG: hypothetical protein K0S47_3104 [Herbinix sp.]|jgi:hypothetical protein|nr:hypothetical protein [Herbinix sp.]